MVVAQRPKPRTKLANGARIRLTIGKGPKARRALAGLDRVDA